MGCYSGMAAVRPSELGRGAGASRRFAVTAWILGLMCGALMCAGLAQSRAGGRAVAALQDMLCCDGCCAASATTSIASAIVSRDAAGASARQSGRPTILHMSGSSEIDYTAGGHRVSQHMESALSELDHLEDHVKDGRPKFLTESAAQREADLMSDKFAHQDLEGKKAMPKNGAGLVDPYEKAEEAQLHQKTPQHTQALHGKRSAPKNKASTPRAGAAKPAHGTERVAEATQLSMAVKRQQKEDSESFREPLHIVSKDLHSAESDAARAVKSIADTKVEGIGSALPSLPDPAKAAADSDHAEADVKEDPHRVKAHVNAQTAHTTLASSVKGGFQPITSSGWNHVLRAQADVVHAAPAGSSDAQDEAILRKLAQSDIDHAKSEHPRQMGVAARAASGGARAMPREGRVAQRTGQESSATAPHVRGEPPDEQAQQPHARIAGPKDGRAVPAKEGGGKRGEGGDEKRLNGVLSRINKLISSQTGGASKHPSYLKHFDLAQAKAVAAKLAALHKQSQAVLAAHAATLQPQRQGLQLKASTSAGSKAYGGSLGAGRNQAELQSAAAQSGARRVALSAARLAAAGGQAREGARHASLRATPGLVSGKGGGGGTAQLRQVRSGMGSRASWRIRNQEPDGVLAGSGVALKEEVLLYGSHHELDPQGVKALKDSSLLGIGL